MFVASVRPLYADTDQMGVVNHAVALRWFELARAEWLRRLGYTYREFEESGFMLPIYEMSARYHKPAYYDQLLLLDAHLELPGPVRVLFHYRVRDEKDGSSILEGITRHAVVNREGKPQRMPEKLRTLLTHGLKEQGAK